MSIDVALEHHEEYFSTVKSLECISVIIILNIKNLNLIKF